MTDKYRPDQDRWDEKAARLWCLPQHGQKEMDVEFAKSIAQALRDAVRKERERCAKVAEDMGHKEEIRQACGYKIAEAIRSSGEPKGKE